MGSTKLEIPYDAIFDIRDPALPPPELTSFSFADLSEYAVMWSKISVDTYFPFSFCFLQVIEAGNY